MDLLHMQQVGPFGVVGFGETICLPDRFSPFLDPKITKSESRRPAFGDEAARTWKCSPIEELVNCSPIGELASTSMLVLANRGVGEHFHVGARQSRSW